MEKSTAQFSLAALALVAAVVINIFGQETTTINTILSSVITACLWGGVTSMAEKGQKEKGRM